MANALIGWLNQFASGTITGSSAAADLSAANLGNDQPSIPWQSTGTTEYVILDAGASVDWGGFGLFATNLSSTALVRWQVYGSATVTNLILQSQVMGTTWARTRANLSSNQALAPDGTVTGDKLYDDSTAANTHLIAQNVTVDTATVYTFSIFAKPAEWSRLRIRFGTSAGGGTFIGDATYNLALGTVLSQNGVSATIVDAGNGWYRCIGTVTSNGTVLGCAVFLMNNSSAVTYDGDGVSGLYLWGGQCVIGSSPGGYVVTTTASASGTDYAYDTFLAEADIVPGYAQTVHIPTSSVAGQYCKVTIYDPNNPDLFIRVGAAYAGPMASPTISFAPGAAEGWQDDSVVTTAKGGQEYISIGATYRVTEIEFADLTEAERYTVALEIDRVAALRSNVLFVPEPDSAYLQRAAIFGRLTQLDPPVRRYPGVTSKRWRIKERK